jgi:acyl-CoA thioesterase
MSANGGVRVFTVVDAVAAMLAADTSLAGLGIEVLHAADGVAVARMLVGADSANGHGIVHGGLVYALADTAFACAANSRVPGSVTASASIVYLSPSRVGEELSAEARVRHAGRRQSIVDVTVHSGDRVVAEYRGTSARLRPDAF